MPFLLGTTNLQPLGLLSEAQQQRFSRVPVWIWVLLVSLVIVVAIIVTLREEEEEALSQAGTPGWPPPTKPKGRRALEPKYPAAAVETPLAPGVGAVEPADEAVITEAETTELIGEVEAITAGLERPPASEAPSAETATGSEAKVKVEAASPRAEETEASPAAAAEPEPASPPRPDNLTRIKGIGPKIAGLLKENGIVTFKQLAEMEPEQIQALLASVGWSRLADPSSWQDQARMLATDKE